MSTVAPVSVFLLGILGMFIVAFAVARIAVLERQVQRPALREPTTRTFAGSGV